MDRVKIRLLSVGTSLSFLVNIASPSAYLSAIIDTAAATTINRKRKSGKLDVLVVSQVVSDNCEKEKVKEEKGRVIF